MNEVKDYINPKLVEKAKETWPDLDENLMTYLLIGADWGYSRAMHEMQVKLFEMGKHGTGTTEQRPDA